MVVVPTMTWLSDLGNRVGIVHHKRQSPNKFPTLGILSLEAGRAMSRLVSLYKSLSDDEIHRLRKEVMRSEGVSYLNSKDEGTLLRLASAERMEDLDRAALSVSRLGKKCNDHALNEFEYAYSDLKLGFIDLGKLDFQSKEIEKIIDKMGKYISSTASLYAGLEALLELESLQRKSKRRKDHNGVVSHKYSEFSEEKLAWQKQQVQHLKENSLWNRPFDKIVGFMARTVFIVYARICIVFGPYTAANPCRHLRFSSVQLQFDKEEPVKEILTSRSGPILKSKHGFLRFLTRDPKPSLSSPNIGFRIGIKEEKISRLQQQAPPSTVGGSGLSLRYANLIIMVEKYLKSPGSITEYVRDDFYMMLPDSLRHSVTLKLKKLLRKEDLLGEDESLAEGWRDGLQVMLGWLAPMAHDTVRWMTERNFEKPSFDAKPKALLLQTLVYADREKTEAAIVEILVGLSCICRYEMHRSKRNGS